MDQLTEELNEIKIAILEHKVSELIIWMVCSFLLLLLLGLITLLILYKK